MTRSSKVSSLGCGLVWVLSMVGWAVLDNPSSAAEAFVNSEVDPCTVAGATARNGKTHEDPEDYVWDASVVIPVFLNGNSIQVISMGVTVDGPTAVITSSGTYSFTGSLTDGRILVNAKGLVRLILNGADIRCTTGAPVHVLNAKKTILVLADQTENHIADERATTLEVNEPNAAVFSKDNLTVCGTGSLVVDANYQDGITSKDGLVIAGGVLTVRAVDDGIRGRDYLVVKGGTTTVIASGDGLISDNDEEATRGYVSLEGGTVKVSARGDALDAQTDTLISGGTITLSGGGGSYRRVDETVSTKGIKAGTNVIIDAGTITVDSADDAVHSDANLIINGGTLALSTQCDALHASSHVVVNGGDIRVTKSSEGIDSNSADIVLNDGRISVVSSGDAVTAPVVLITDANLAITSGGGSGKVVSATASAKGIKGKTTVLIEGGVITVDAADDAVHSDANVVISGGTLSLSTGDDGIHGNTSVMIHDGDIRILRCYEGIESRLAITINGGQIHITSSDDGLNIAPPGTNFMGSVAQLAALEKGAALTINGGYLAMNAAGDGLDIGGAIVMTGGTVLVQGPTANDNGALDHDQGCNVTGGFLVAAGSSGMAMAPSTTSTQYSILVNLTTTLAAGTLFHIQASDGTNVLTYRCTKQTQSVAFCAPLLVKGRTYDIYTGGSSTGTVTDGLVQGGTYTAGTKYGSFTISSMVTTLGSTGGMGGGGTPAGGGTTQPGGGTTPRR